MQLSHKILDLLPRGSDGEKLIEAIEDRLKEEQRACADIALALDSLRGNEKEIAKAILARANQS